MEEFVYYNNLFDIYGGLLTEKEQITFKDYYYEDLSLGEIAEEKNVSRSAVQKILKNVLEKLKYYESNLHICANNSRLREILEINDIDKIKKELWNLLNE